MKQNQRGFSTVEIILLVVVIFIIGFAGWWVWKSNRTSNLKLSTTAQTVPIKTESKPVEKTTASQNSSKGYIEGELSYPADGLPPMKVCATQISSNDVTCFDNPLTGVTSYRIEVKSGDYNVYAQLKSKEGDITTDYKAYYDQYGICSSQQINCSQSGHKQYIKVIVKAGETTSKINLQDWYNL